MIFKWIGNEGRTQYWVASTLNTLRRENPSLFRPVYGTIWAPKMISRICARECYTGRGIFNKNKRVPNPDKPLENLTDEIPRTLLRPKPETEWHYYEVPQLTTGELKDNANSVLKERGRGRGKEGKKVEALLRGRIFCPVCSKPIAVKRKTNGEVYYHCRTHLSKWKQDPCYYNRFITARWDGDVWNEICCRLKDDQWVDKQINSESKKNGGIEKLIGQQESRISNTVMKIWRVEEGFDGGLYTLKEAKRKKQSYQHVIDTTRIEIERLKDEIRGFTQHDIDVLRHELQILRDRNLEEATFDERVDLVAKLGLKVFPSEDLKSRKISCRLPLEIKTGEREQVGVAKEVFGSAYGIRTRGLRLERAVS
jgi:hypothetical protein